MIDIKPPIKLDHLEALTDDTGILQHTKYSIPNRKEGYTTDDNARGLVTCIKFLQHYEDSDVTKLAKTYLSFLFHMQRPDGKFHNLLSYDREFLDDLGSEDCIGRSLWACGYAISTNLSKGIKTTSKEIFDKGFPHASSFKSLRAKAFTILGLCHYHEAFRYDQNLSKNIVSLADQLARSYQQVSSPDWRWFEPYLTYLNGRLSHALFRAYDIVGDERYLHIAKESLDFLVELHVVGKKFVPIGNKGWYKKGGHRALYDQQPIEASCMVEAAATAFQVINEKKYQGIAYIAFDWFLGKNSKNEMVYDRTTGACYDGITPQGLNLNQGAEATISYLLARLELETLSHARAHDIETRRQVASKSEPMAGVVRATSIATGCGDLDDLLLGGIPENYTVVLTSPSCDERDLLIKRFLEAGAKKGEVTFYVTIDPGGVKTLARKHQSNFFLFVCNPAADAIIKSLPNVSKLKGVKNLTDISIALTSTFRRLNKSPKGPRRACIEIISDVLLEHHAASTRKWLTALIPKLKSRGFTTLAVMNPQMHPPQEVQAILGLFEGEINIYEKETKKGLRKHLKVKKMANQRYLDSETPLRKKRLQK